MDDRSIDRADIGSSTAEPNSPDLVLESYFRRQLEQLYADPSPDLVAKERTELGDSGGATTVERIESEDEKEYDFKLFTRPLTSGPASVGANNVSQRIALRSPSPGDGEAGFTREGRPIEYYFAGHTGAELAEQYSQAAVSDQDIVDGLRMRWVCGFVLDLEIGTDLLEQRGMELPWRVTLIKTTDPGKVVGQEHLLQAQTNKRKRSGKKRRIIVRKKIEAGAAQEAAAKQTQVEREAAEREKRTRKNREKKVKKRQKDKLKKMNDPA